MAQPSDQNDEHLRSVRSIRTERHQALEAAYGGIHWGADFLGFAVATFFTVVFFGIVGAIVGTVGYQMGAPVPHVGGPVTGTTASLGLAGLIGGLIALFLAYLLGGYAAGRMVHFSGALNGLGVVIWTVIVAIILGIAGSVIGANRFNVGSQLNLHINTATLTTAGIISLVVTLIVMILGAVLGGTLGARYHPVERMMEEVS
ncbi:MAG TPA: hypothetical protein VFB58_04085 [Chloroflexota bacterium]|nr:hypothetical protein [Chloroflexota bacterium]